MSYEIPATWEGGSTSTTAAAASASSHLLAEFDPLEEGGRQGKLVSLHAEGEHQSTEVASQLASDQARSAKEEPTAGAVASPPPSPPPPELPPKSEAAAEGGAGISQGSQAPSSLITAIAGTFAKRKAAEPQSATSATAPELPAKDQGAPPISSLEGSTRPARSQSTGSSRSGGHVQFDFPRFLEQLKSRPAEPVAKYLKSFLTNFAKRSFTMNESIKLVRDFLDFIAQRMAEVEPWRSMDEAEFEMALEGMEKLVMNRIYPFTFTPQIDRSKHAITTDDLEQDNVLAQRARLFGWIEGQHLDFNDGSKAEAQGDMEEAQAIKGYLKFAGQELLKVNHYKAPRDKLICILNCCKVIFGLMRHIEGNTGQGADSFIPILIYVVLKSNPPHLISNIEYINRFRSANKLQAEAGYYLSSLTGTITFIESMDYTSLSNITKEDFEANVESAVAHLPPPSPVGSTSVLNKPPLTAAAAVSAAAAPFSTTLEGEEPAPQITSGAQTFALDTKRFLAENISRPLNAIGKIFAEAVDGSEADRAAALGEERRRQSAATTGEGGQPAYQPRIRSPRPQPQVGAASGSNLPPPAAGPSLWDTISADLLSVLPSSARSTPPPPPPAAPSSPAPPLPPRDFYAAQRAAYPHQQRQALQSRPDPLIPFSNEYPADDDNIDFERLQTELDRRDATARQESLTALSQMFPNMDAELAAMVLDSVQGDVTRAAEAMLDMGVD